MSNLKAIPQKYDGLVYRSRTEARWAEFFRLTLTPYQYEPEGYQLGSAWYVPDFWLTEAESFFEVKGGAPTLPERHKAQSLKMIALGRLLGCGDELIRLYNHYDMENRFKEARVKSVRTVNP